MSISQSIAHLVLENGMCFQGLVSCHPLEVFGEIVFNTSMTGYQEIITDPSYADQIIVFTHPHLGNTGINREDHESPHVWAKGIVARQISSHSNHWQSCLSLPAFLSAKKVPYLFQVDTRTIVRTLVRQGSQWGAMVTGNFDQAAMLNKIQQAKRNAFPCLVSQVSTKKPYVYCSQSSNKFHVIVYDFGVKKNILQTLQEMGCSVTVVPWNTTYQTTLSFKPQGIVLSNGPGDPLHCQEVFETVRQFLLKQIPVMGICLGHQILALSMGAKIVKMKYGHHGSNHPTSHESANRFFISSQNHNFTISDVDLPKSLQVTSRSLFDQTIQGLSHRSSPAFGFQGHPEASPGPHDLKQMFADFLQMMRKVEE
jgi:carbamoyl-phosphate synthase small subunit